MCWLQSLAVNMALPQKGLTHSPTDYHLCIYVITQQPTQFILISHLDRKSREQNIKLELQEMTAVILGATETYYEFSSEKYQEYQPFWDQK